MYRSAVLQRLIPRISLYAATTIPYEIRSSIHGKPDIILYPNGNIALKSWRNRKGYLHNVRGPAEIKFNLRGQKTMESWYKNGKRNRVNKPALIIYGPDGFPSREVWYSNGTKSKEHFYNNNQLIKQRWFDKEGKRHRSKKQGPAEITYRPGSSPRNITEKLYFNHGKRIRESTPRINRPSQ